MFTLGRRSIGQKLSLYNYLKRTCKKVVVGIFSKATSDMTRGNGFKLHQGRFRDDFFCQKFVKHWNRLSGEVAELPSLEVFKKRLDVALSATF